jgi:co-chaperonin GroES (HSP10)
MEEIVAKTKKEKKKEFDVMALGKRVLVKRDEKKEVSEGGIILSEGAQDIPEEGVVISVGSEVTSVKIGDKVLLPSHGVDINIRGNTLAVLLEEELYVKIYEH